MHFRWRERKKWRKVKALDASYMSQCKPGMKSNIYRFNLGLVPVAWSHWVTATCGPAIFVHICTVLLG